jgi:hypothetical protein
MGASIKTSPTGPTKINPVGALHLIPVQDPQPLLAPKLSPSQTFASSGEQLGFFVPVQVPQLFGSV